MLELCRPGNTCAGCPAMGLGIELGAQVAQTAQAVHDNLGLEALRSFRLKDLKNAVIADTRFSPEVTQDGAPYYTAVGVLKRIMDGGCPPYNNQLNEGEI